MSSFVAATTAGRSQCGNWSPDGVPFSPNGVKRHRHRRVRLGSLARSRRSRSPGTRCRGADAICDHDGAATLTSHVPAPNNSFLLMQKQRQHQQLNAEVFRHRRPSHSTQLQLLYQRITFVLATTNPLLEVAPTTVRLVLLIYRLLFRHVVRSGFPSLSLSAGKRHISKVHIAAKSICKGRRDG